MHGDKAAKEGHKTRVRPQGSRANRGMDAIWEQWGTGIWEEKWFRRKWGGGAEEVYWGNQCPPNSHPLGTCEWILIRKLGLCR